MVSTVKPELPNISALDNDLYSEAKNLLSLIEALYDDNKTPIKSEGSAMAWITAAENLERMLEKYTSTDKPIG
jgi:hypothetical protein